MMGRSESPRRESDDEVIEHALKNESNARESRDDDEQPPQDKPRSKSQSADVKHEEAPPSSESAEAKKGPEAVIDPALERPPADAPPSPPPSAAPAVPAESQLRPAYPPYPPMYGAYPPPPPGHGSPPPGATYYAPYPPPPHGYYEVGMPPPSHHLAYAGYPPPPPPPHHGTHGSYPPPPPPPHTGHGDLVAYTDDASTKITDRIRRRCFNCCTTDTSTWRRSNLHPGKVLCNKCGLFERTHARPRPDAFPHKRTTGRDDIQAYPTHAPYPPPAHVAPLVPAPVAAPPPPPAEEPATAEEKA